jgi:hypothetical protein
MNYFVSTGIAARPMLFIGFTTFTTLLAACGGGAGPDTSSTQPGPALLATVAVASGKAYYVAPSGSDSNPGTSAAPFKTIMKAASVATAGVTVHVADGTYRETITSSNSGTASAYITFQSDNKWGAKIISPATGHSAAWHNTGDYVAIIGFDITGGGAVGINHSGSGDIANQNHVHHIPAT